MARQQTSQSQGRKPTFRQNGAADPSHVREEQGALFDTPDSPEPQERQPRRKGGRPKGYGDDLRWDMAERFERRALENHVPLHGNVPFIYKALTEITEQTGLRTMKVTDGKGNPVYAARLGVKLVDYFWDRAPWDRDEDVIIQFTDPVMFRDCLRALLKSWAARRTLARLRANPLTDNDEVYVRADR